MSPQTNPSGVPPGRRRFPARGRAAAAFLAMLALAAVWVLWPRRDRSVVAYQAESTRQMAQVLAGLPKVTDEFLGMFLAKSGYGIDRPVELPSTANADILELWKEATGHVRGGRNAEAIAAYLKLREHLARATPPIPLAFHKRVQFDLAVAYFRLAEQQNCVALHSSESCLLPIRGSGIHRQPEGTRLAVQELTDYLLTGGPDSVEARWLLNIGTMALGEYPDDVPLLWLIPPGAFESDYDIKRFPNVAPDPERGLDAVRWAGVSGSCCLEDFDGDGDLDLLSSRWSLSYQLRFYLNRGDGYFTDHTSKAGIEGLVGGLNMVHGDYDNDGYADVVILRGAWHGKLGRIPLTLLHNNGNNTFEDVTVAAGLLAAQPTQTAAWADYDNDGLLDLFVGYEASQQDVYPCRLYRNQGNGTFVDVAAEAGVDLRSFVKGTAWGDYDNDGLQDLYVSMLSAPNELLRNLGPDPEGVWHFQKVGESAGVTEPVRSFPVWFWDYNNDGWEDLLVLGYNSTLADVVAEYLGQPSKGQVPCLYRNNGDGSFTDVAQEARVDKPLLAMGCNFGDLDNDGWLDFYVGTGDPDFSTLVPNRMFRNAEGRYFQDVTTSGGFGSLQKGHGVAFGDIDDDGDQDVYSVLGGGFSGDTSPNQLFLNPGHGNHWITLRLEGVRSNRSAIGARIQVTVDTPHGPRTIYATVRTGGSFGSESLQQELGLGQAKAIRTVRVTWPATGESQVFPGLAMDRRWRIREGAAHAVGE